MNTNGVIYSRLEIVIRIFKKVLIKWKELVHLNDISGHFRQSQNDSLSIQP